MLQTFSRQLNGKAIQPFTMDNELNCLQTIGLHRNTITSRPQELIIAFKRQLYYTFFGSLIPAQLSFLASPYGTHGANIELVFWVTWVSR